MSGDIPGCDCASRTVAKSTIWKEKGCGVMVRAFRVRAVMKMVWALGFE